MASCVYQVVLRRLQTLQHRRVGEHCEAPSTKLAVRDHTAPVFSVILHTFLQQKSLVLGKK